MIEIVGRAATATDDELLLELLLELELLGLLKPEPLPALLPPEPPPPQPATSVKAVRSATPRAGAVEQILNTSPPDDIFIPFSDISNMTVWKHQCNTA
ncbi:MAG TPA: hypothetical protein VF402_10610 [Asticcacaulis sp.]